MELTRQIAAPWIAIRGTDHRGSSYRCWTVPPRQIEVQDRPRNVREGASAKDPATLAGRPRYIAAQTLVVIVWIALNAIAAGLRWDPYPFILLNLAFSTQAAYAAPLILLAQTRQADRDKLAVDHSKPTARRSSTTCSSGGGAQAGDGRAKRLLASNTQLTQQDKELTERVEALTREIHSRVLAG